MRVLIVDDESLIRMDLRDIIESSGHEVVAEGTNGVEAIKLCKEYKPDILVSDPVYKNLVNEYVTFIPLLHYGYSTRLYLDLDYEYCGKKAYEYFKKFI